MTSIYQNTLPIPENTVQGSGGYTVPANKYVKFDGSAAISALGWVGTSTAYDSEGLRSNSQNSASSSLTSTATVSNINTTLMSGDTITVSSTVATVQSNMQSGNTSWSNQANPRASININATPVCIAKACCSSKNANYSSSGMYNGTRSLAEIGWTAAEYPIPKNNLPTDLIEGN